MQSDIQVSSMEFDTLPSYRKWPFSNMAIGQTVTYDRKADPDMAKKAQNYCGIYGRANGKKFESRTVNKDGKKVLVIRRIS
jgi:hypothetical protein